MMTTHGHTRNRNVSAEYRTWLEVMRRCYNTKRPAYKDYGGRGIKVCERWHSFENFYTDMGNRPSDLHSIDRKNNNGNYEPDNCRWATIETQANNKRDTRIIEFQGERLSVAQWARRIGISACKITCRLDKGWTPALALANPPIRLDRRIHPIEFEGRIMPIYRWAEEKGISAITLWTRLFTYGWSIERSLTEPARAHNRKKKP